MKSQMADKKTNLELGQPLNSFQRPQNPEDPQGFDGVQIFPFVPSTEDTQRDSVSKILQDGTQHERLHPEDQIHALPLTMLFPESGSLLSGLRFKKNFLDFPSYNTEKYLLISFMDRTTDLIYLKGICTEFKMEAAIADPLNMCTVWMSC